MSRYEPGDASGEADAQVGRHALPKLLLIDDDVDLCEILHDFLMKNNIDSDFVHSGQDALHSLLSSEAPCYDLLVLDITLPKVSGLKFLEKIRSRSLDIPVIMLTGRTDIQDKLTALNIGADDYICKPCDPRELLARIRNILRRSDGEKQKPEAQSALLSGDVRLDRSARIVHIGKNAVDLTGVEFRLLDILMENAGSAVSLQSLSIDILKRPYAPDDRSLNQHVSHLRHKLGPHPNGVERIKTIRGKGFIYIPCSAANEDTKI